MIFYTNSGFVIRPYDKGDCGTLERMTSIYDKVYHKYIEVTGFYDDDEESFCTHWISPKFVQRLLPHEMIVKVGTPIGYPLDKFSLIDDIKLTDTQINTIHKVLDSKHDRVFINLPTGEGKTLLSVYYIISCISRNALILCFSTKVLEQWYETFRTKTTIDIDKVIIINSSKKILKILENLGSKHHIYLCTPGLLVKFAKTHGWERLQKFVECIGVGVQIFDEAHRNIGALVKLDAHLPIKKRIYLSADLNATHEKRDMYFKIFNNCTIVRLDQDELNDTKFIKCIIVEFDSQPSMTDSLSIYSGYGFSNDKYMRYEFSKPHIFNAIDQVLDIIISKHDTNHTILILMNMIEHVDNVTEYLSKKYPGIKVGKYHSKMSSDEKKESLETSDIIVSTHKSLGTGFDTGDNRKIRYILCLDNVNEIEDDQSAGRMRRDGDLEAFYFIFTDSAFEYSRRKVNRKLKYLCAMKFKEVFKIKIKT